MKKNAYFGENDRILLRRIEEFRINVNITTFSAAVRELCRIALEVNDIKKRGGI